MTTIYIEEVDNVNDGEKNIFVFDTENAALEEAGSDILNLMSESWDLYDDSDNQAARDIQDDIKAGNYREAISAYNDYESNRNSNYSSYISVYEKLTISGLTARNYINFSDYEPEEDEDEDEDEDESVDSSPFVASVQGATCRGSCGNPSTDAYADKRDGTYVCYQCKLFNGVFGKP